jgi:hypothetical protein
MLAYAESYLSINGDIDFALDFHKGVIAGFDTSRYI